MESRLFGYARVSTFDPVALQEAHELEAANDGKRIGAAIDFGYSCDRAILVEGEVLMLSPISG